MTRLQEWLLKAGAQLNVEIIVPFRTRLPSGRILETPAFVVGIGGPEGMLVVTSLNDIRPALAELAAAGYGYSVLSEPSNSETFDLETFRELFADWTGSPDSGK